MTAKENLRNRSTVKPQGDDAAFLVEEFDVGEQDAAKLVQRDGATTADIEREARKKQQQHDPLDGVPVPEGGPEHIPDSDEVQKKPVLHSRHDRTGGG